MDFKAPLTEQQLLDMEPGKIFATAVTTDPAIYWSEIRWIAKRGDGIHDWTIYYNHSHQSIAYIKYYGDKIIMDSNITKLVPCDEGALKMYRK